MSETTNTNLIKLSEIKSKEDYKKISIKPYLSFSFKKVIINNILNLSKIENEQNLVKIDYALLEMIKNIMLVNNYSDLDLSEYEDIFQAYDLMQENGVLEYIFGEIPIKEIDFFDIILEQEITQLLTVENSVSGVLAKTLNKLVDRIPDSAEINKMIPKLSKEISKISPETMEILKGITKIDTPVKTTKTTKPKSKTTK
jgi:hypothetical protein